MVAALRELSDLNLVIVACLWLVQHCSSDVFQAAAHHVVAQCTKGSCDVFGYLYMQLHQLLPAAGDLHAVHCTHRAHCATL